MPLSRQYRPSLFYILTEREQGRECLGRVTTRAASVYPTRHPARPPDFRFERMAAHRGDRLILFADAQDFHDENRAARLQCETTSQPQLVEVQRNLGRR
jgi:hypothetical protein